MYEVLKRLFKEKKVSESELEYAVSKCYITTEQQNEILKLKSHK